MLHAGWLQKAANKLQECIYLAILYACSIDDNQVRAGSLGLMELIKAAMERHASSDLILEIGVGALGTICLKCTVISVLFELQIF